MKEIPLTQNKIAIVADEDFPFLSQYKWRTQKGPDGHLYARTRINANGIITHPYMHTLLMNPSCQQMVDFKDGNGLNLLRGNMRLCSNKEDAQNRRQQSNNRSGYKGISWGTKENKWVAFITVDGVHKRIGTFTNAIDAAQAYDDEAKKYFGSFAQLNFADKQREGDQCESISSILSSQAASLPPQFFSRSITYLKTIPEKIWRLMHLIF